MFTRRFWIRRFLPVSLILGTATAVALAAQVGVRQLTLPRRSPLEPWMSRITENPGGMGLRLRPFTVKTADNCTLQALLVDPTAKAGTTTRGKSIVKALKTTGLVRPAGAPPRGTLILLHGLNGRKENMLPFAERFAAAGFRCVVYDSRAHGDSSGVRVTYGAMETDDLQRVLAAAKTAAGPRGLGPVGFLGYSLGGAVCLQTQPHLPEVRALCSISAFAELQPVMTEQADHLWNGVGTPLLPVVRLETRLQAGFDPWTIRPVEAASRVTCPVLLVHGSKDDLVPVGQARSLAQALGKNCRETVLIPTGTHGSVFTEGGEALRQRMAVFFAKELTPPPRAIPVD
ncbi:MAG: alpha/beta fold hydrolase [Verrucomicrobiota bacterium]